MSWKLFWGANAENALNAMLSNPLLPLIHEFPRGKSWAYDVCPSDSNHLIFIQPRALSRRVSVEFIVPGLPVT